MRSFVKYIAILTSIYVSAKAQKSNPLNNKHLRVRTIEYPISLVVNRNATGHVIGFGGLLTFHMEALSKMYNFSYSYLPNSSGTLESMISTSEGISYIASGEVDLFLSTTVATPSRFKYFDFPASWYNGHYGLIVAFPKETLNLKASLKPFSNEVWITIAIATLAIIFYLRIRWVKKTQNGQHITYQMENMENRRQIVDFVLGNLVSQGQRFFSNQLAYRIAGGAWCTGCFFLVQMYCSTLTSHLTSPNQLPIVASLKELINTPDVDFTIDKGPGMDVQLSTMLKIGIFKNLEDKLEKDSKLRCDVTADCLTTVRNGHAAYSAPVSTLKEIVERDLKNTGLCNYYLMKDSFLSSHIFNVLPKNSPYTSTINMGILRLHQFGFYDVWAVWFSPEPRKCMELPRKKATPRLSKAHLSSAFLILIAGYIVSIIVFIFEKVFYYFRLLIFPLQ